MVKALQEYRKEDGAKKILESMEALKMSKICWKDTVYVERKSEGLSQVSAEQIKYTRIWAPEISGIRGRFRGGHALRVGL